jgi:hypothetical protein
MIAVCRGGQAVLQYKAFSVEYALHIRTVVDVRVPFRTIGDFASVLLIIFRQSACSLVMMVFKHWQLDGRSHCVARRKTNKTEEERWKCWERKNPKVKKGNP